MTKQEFKNESAAISPWKNKVQVTQTFSDWKYSHTALYLNTNTNQPRPAWS